MPSTSPPRAEDPAAPASTFLKLVLLTNLVARPFARLHERAHGLRLSEWRILRALCLRPGHATAGVVGEELGMDKMAASRAVRALESRGRLTRSPDPRDGRRIVLEPTEAGRALFALIEPTSRDREAALLETLSPEERAVLDDLLDRLVDRARALPEPQGAAPQLNGDDGL